jgi:hypothetical protein
MMYLKWILLLVCVALTLWPLLAGGRERDREEGRQS